MVVKVTVISSRCPVEDSEGEEKVGRGAECWSQQLLCPVAVVLAEAAMPDHSLK